MFQGGTIKFPTALVVDIDSLFAPGMLYTALGRIQNISQLYLRMKDPDLLMQKIRTNQKTLEETRCIAERAINRAEAKAEDIWLRPSPGKLKVVSLNIR